MRISITIKLLVPLIVMMSILTWLAITIALNTFAAKQLDSTKRYISDVASQAAMQFDISVGEKTLKRIVTSLAIGDHIIQAVVVDPQNDDIIASSLYRYAEHRLEELPEQMQIAYRQNQTTFAFFTEVINGHYAMSLPVNVLNEDNQTTQQLYLLFYLDTLIMQNQFSDWRRQIVGASLAFLAVLIILLSALVNVFITQPLSRFQNTLQRQSNTDVLLPVNIHTKDEFGSIATEFNRFIAQEKETQDSNQASIAAAELLADKKSQFLANMSHEIRTPLNGIIGLAQLCQSTPSGAQLQQYLQQMMLSSQLLVSVVDDILMFSRLSESELSLVEEFVSLNELLDGVVPMMKVLANNKNILLEQGLTDACPIMARVDATRVQQVLINIINNAIKFTPSGRVTLQLDFEPMSATTGLLIFQISDTGIGIAEQDMKRLFDPFEQLDTSSSRDFGGTGLGLAICQRLINLMNGDIKVTSTLGKGSQFTISIPCSFKSPNDSDDHATPLELNSPLTQPSATILVAEDNDINAMIVCDMLKILGHKVMVASNGKIALAAALKRNFDLILMDVQMPEMDGMESTIAIRKAGIKTPIVGLSANVLEHDKLKAVEAGMNDYLHKPIIFEKLAESVNQWVVSKVEC